MTTTASNNTQRPKSKWGLILKIIVTVASAIAGIFGISACGN